MRRRRPKDRTDRSMGIRASRVLQLPGLVIDSDNAQYGNRYEPTPADVVDDMLLDLDIEHEQFVFVDLGSGKGRVLCLASTYPFKRIVGVEFCKELHEAAVDNIRAFSAPWQRCETIVPTLTDAALFEFPREPTVLFLYNPFQGPVMLSVLRNLRRSIELNPRPIYVLYYEPLHQALLDRAPFLRKMRCTADRAVYRTIGSSDRAVPATQ